MGFLQQLLQSQKTKLMDNKVDVDPDMVFGLQKIINERLYSSFAKNDTTFPLALSAFLKMKAKDRNKYFNILEKGVEKDNMSGEINSFKKEYPLLKILNKGIVIPSNGVIEIRRYKNAKDSDILENSEAKCWCVVGDNSYDLLKISFLHDENFKFKLKNLLSGTVVDKATIVKKISEVRIMQLLGINKKSELMSWEQIIWRTIYLINLQPKGEKGLLLTDGKKTTMGYFFGKTWVGTSPERICAVRVNWYKDAWRVRVNTIQYLDKGEEIIIPHGILKK